MRRWRRSFISRIFRSNGNEENALLFIVNSAMILTKFFPQCTVSIVICDALQIHSDYLRVYIGFCAKIIQVKVQEYAFENTTLLE